MIPPHPAPPRTLATALLVGALLSAGPLLAGCKSKPYRGTAMGDTDQLPGIVEDASPEELKLRLYVFVEQFSDEVELAADRIQQESTDPAVRRLALQWKAQAVAECQLAAFHHDPFAGAMDTWALCLQMDHFLTEGDGAVLFGDLQPIALEATRRLLPEIEDVLRTVALDADLTPGRQLVGAWVEENPIEGELFVRQSSIPDLAPMVARAEGALESVVSLEQQFDDLTRRTRFYAAHLPRQARWQAELLVHDLKEGRELKELSATLSSIATSLDRIATITEKASTMVDEERAALREQLSGLRASLMDTLDQQRQAVDDDIGGQREALTADLSGLVGDSLDRSMVLSEALIDRFFLRAAQLLGGAAVAFLLIALVLRRRQRVPG